jgi:hypothetical protein
MLWIPGVWPSRYDELRLLIFPWQPDLRRGDLSPNSPAEAILLAMDGRMRPPTYYPRPGVLPYPSAVMPGASVPADVKSAITRIGATSRLLPLQHAGEQGAHPEWMSSITECLRERLSFVHDRKYDRESAGVMQRNCLDVEFVRLPGRYAYGRSGDVLAPPLVDIPSRCHLGLRVRRIKRKAQLRATIPQTAPLRSRPRSGQWPAQ